MAQRSATVSTTQSSPAALAEVAASVRECRRCGNIAVGGLCTICADPARATGELCVVETVADLWAMERGGAFRGRYHVLGGVLSALDAVTPESLRIPGLVARASEEATREVILALNATIDGQTTAHYIADALAPLGVTVTSLAKGVPIGGELDDLALLGPEQRRVDREPRDRPLRRRRHRDEPGARLAGHLDRVEPVLHVGHPALHLLRLLHELAHVAKLPQPLQHPLLL